MSPALPSPLMTTGIGSVPFAEPDEAAAFVLDAGLSVPFWPQLPRRRYREQMIPQFAARLPCVRIDELAGRTWFDRAEKYTELEPFYEAYLSEDPQRFALDEDEAAGLAAFERAAAGRTWPAVKGQLTGPITLTTSIADAAKTPLYGDADLRDAAVKLLARTAAWQVGRLAAFGEGPVLLFVDEPAMAAYGSSTYLGILEEDVRQLEGEVFEAIRAAGGVPGMHVCGNSDWGVVLATGVAVLNFDAYQYGTTIALYPEAVAELFHRGGAIAWGIVPTTAAVDAETVDSLAERFDRCLDALQAKGFDRPTLLDHALLTPSCGTGNITPDQAGRVFRLLAGLRAKLLGEPQA